MNQVDALVVISSMCVLLLAYAALHDVVGRTIPNSVSVALAALGCLRAALEQTLLASLTIAAMIFLTTLLAWRRGLLGGGDVKLLTAASLMVVPRDVPVLLLSISMIGGMLACLYLLARKLVPQPQPLRPRHLVGRAVRVELWRVHRRGPLPYAVAIALGAITQIVGH